MLLINNVQTSAQGPLQLCLCPRPPRARAVRRARKVGLMHSPAPQVCCLNLFEKLFCSSPGIPVRRHGGTSMQV